MFDLNELPEHDIDMLPPCDHVACMQPARDSRTCRTQAEEPDGSFVIPCCEVANASMSIDIFPVHQVDLAPLPLGQHPLSCFRPFVRPILKEVFENGAKGDVHPMRSMLGQQSLATSCNRGLRTGEHVRIDNISWKQTVDTSPITSESCGYIRDSRNCHHILGPEDCNGIVQRLKNTDVQELPGFSIDGTDIEQEALFHSTFVQGPEKVQQKVSLRSAVVDACMKVDVSKEVSSTVESKPPSTFLKRGRPDQKDAMLGKKRARQTMFLDVREAAKQVPPPKASGMKKGSSLLTPRNHKEAFKTPATPFSSDARLKDSKSSGLSCDGFRGMTLLDVNGNSLASPEGMIAEGQAQSQGLVMKFVPSSMDDFVEGFSRVAATSSANNSCLKVDGVEKAEDPQLHKPVVGSHPGGSQRKLDGELQPASYVRPLAKKNLNNYKKQFPYPQDSSIERLHREATCEKLWKSPGEAELRRVPGSFDSVQEYMNVFEPLLFEECRAQLHSTWEELCEGVRNDPHVQVSVKAVEKRDRGWYDLVLLPLETHARLGFEEGDVAVLSTPKPTSGFKEAAHRHASLTFLLLSC